MSKEQSVFEVLSSAQLDNKVKLKGGNGITYIPWSVAWRELVKRYPQATYVVHEFSDKEYGLLPYLKTPAGVMVKVSVDVSGLVRTVILPVLNHKNQVLFDADMMQINKAIMRCLTKAIALHGFGLDLWAGSDEDPYAETDAKKPDPATEKTLAEINAIITQNGSSLEQLVAWASAKYKRDLAGNLANLYEHEALSILQSLKNKAGNNA